MVALAAKAAGGGGGGRSIGDHPDGGAVTVREGRFGPYVNWGKVNATIPKSIPVDMITLTDALELIAEREGQPPKKGGSKPAKSASPKKAPAKKAPSKAAPTKKSPTKTAAAKKSSAKKAVANKA